MKTLRLTLLSTLVVAASTAPALACEYHDGNGWFMPGSQWRNFSPKVTTTDPSLMDDEDELITVPGPAARRTIERKRPSFSSAADRANRAARTKVLMMADDAPKAPTAAASDETQAEPASESNAQTVR